MNKRNCKNNSHHIKRKKNGLKRGTNILGRGKAKKPSKNCGEKGGIQKKEKKERVWEKNGKILKWIQVEAIRDRKRGDKENKK